MKAILVVCLLGLATTSANPASYNELSMDMREAQILAIIEGAHQLSNLLKESWNTGASAARALQTNFAPANLARALQESDPIEAALKTLHLDTETCRNRLVCEIQSKMDSYSMGDLVYEYAKRKVPKLKKYGTLTARSLGSNNCYEVFQCRFASSPYMENAKHLRSLVQDFCNLDNNSITSKVCRGIKAAVDKLETL